MQTLLFYIGNGILKCALVDLSSGPVPKFLFSETSDIEMAEGNIYKTELELSLNRSLDDLCQKARNIFLKPEIRNKRIKEIICIVSAPWYLSQTKTFKTRRTESFLIKENTISDFVEEAEKEMQKNYPESMELSERKIIHISLNGYVTNKPLHQRVNSLEVSVVQSFVEAKLMKDVKSIIEKYFYSRHFKFHTLSLASFIALRDVLSQKDNFILIDVTSLVTEISLIKQDILYETVSLPIGARKLLELAAKGLNVTMPIALSILGRYQNGNLEADLTEKVKAILNDFKTSWSKYLNETFRHLSGGISLPSSCYILCRMPLEKIFSEFVSAEEYSQFSFSEGKFSVEIISGTTFLPTIDFNKQPVDSSLAISALFAKKIISKLI